MFWDLGFGKILVLVCCVILTFWLTVGEFRVVEGGGGVVFLFDGGSVLDGALDLICCVLIGISDFIGEKLAIFSGEVVGANKTVTG